MQVKANDSMQAIAAKEWDALNFDDYPFLRHAFLQAAETTRCVAPRTGWQPRHITVRDDAGTLVAAMPLYEKTHSFGEFVFDWAWAQAYERAGLTYYPKLVSAIPFTPASSTRLLSARPDDPSLAATLLDAALDFARDSGQSSLHIQFPRGDELAALQGAGLKIRKDCQFHWHNRDYATFDDFLQAFSSRKRKKARRDRRSVAEQGITFRRLHGDEMTDVLWRRVYELISLTFLRRGSMPYFSLPFFQQIAAAMPHGILVILAERTADIVAAAVFFVSPTTLYGRYWGCDGHFDALHFETCYYQGIEYCIEQQLQVFEPGTQGEHKVSRGFHPVSTWSAHWLAHDRFFSAIGHYLDEEQQHVDRYIEAVVSHSPYRGRGFHE